MPPFNRKDLFGADITVQSRYSTQDKSVVVPSGQEQAIAQYNISDFTGGINIDSPGLSLDKTQFVEMENFIIDDQKTLRVRDSFKLRTPTASYPEEHIRFISDGRGGDERLIFAYKNSSGDIYVKFFSSGSTTATNIFPAGIDSDPLFPGSFISEMDFITFGDRISSGQSDEILIFPDNGIPWRKSDILHTPLNKAYEIGLKVFDDVNMTIGDDVSSNPGLKGNYVGGNYWFRYTVFYDKAGTSKYGESQPSEPTKIALTAYTDETRRKFTFTLSATYVFPNIGASKILVYRSPVDREEGPYRYVGEILADKLVGSEDPLDFEDSLEYDELPLIEPPLPGDYPVALKYPYQVLDVIYAFEAANPNKLVWCAPGQPDRWPAQNYANLEDIGTGIIQFLGNIYIWTRNQIYMIKESDSSKPPVKISDIGCSSHRTIVDVETGVMWLGPENVYWANFNKFNKDGELPHAVGNNIQSIIRGLPPDFDRLSCATAFDDHYYLSASEVGGGNNITYAMNLRSGGWSKMDFVGADMSTSNNKFYRIDKQLADNGDIGTYNTVFEHGADKNEAKDLTYDGGTKREISATIRTGPLLLGHEFSDSIIKSISIVAEASSTYIQITVFFPDTGLSFTKGNIDPSAPSDQKYLLGKTFTLNAQDFLIWDESYWANDDNEGSTPNWYYVNTTAGQQHFKLQTGLKGKIPQVEFKFANAGLLKVVGASIYHAKMMPPA